MKKKLKISKIFGFISMALAFLRIPMVFLPITTAVGFSIFDIDAFIFSIDSLFSFEGIIGTSIAVIMILLGGFLALPIAILAIFAKKPPRIIGTVLASLMFVDDLIAIIIAGVSSYGLKPGLGTWLAFIFSTMIFIFMIVATVLNPTKQQRLDAENEEMMMEYADADSFANGYGTVYDNQGYNQYADQQYADPYAQQYADPNAYVPVVPTAPDTDILTPSTVQMEKNQSGYLAMVGGGCDGFQIPVIPGEEIIIGKDPAQCSVIIDRSYSSISRKHCGVGYDPYNDIYLVTDYSTNGVSVVGGVRLQQNELYQLAHGTTLEFNATDIQVQLY